MQKLQCFGHLMQKGNSLEKTLMLGKIEGTQAPTEVPSWLLLYSPFAIVPFLFYIFHSNRAHFANPLCSRLKG